MLAWCWLGGVAPPSSSPSCPPLPLGSSSSTSSAIVTGFPLAAPRCGQTQSSAVAWVWEVAGQCPAFANTARGLVLQVLPNQPRQADTPAIPFPCLAPSSPWHAAWPLGQGAMPGAPLPLPAVMNDVRNCKWDAHWRRDSIWDVQLYRLKTEWKISEKSNSSLKFFFKKMLLVIEFT